MSKRADSITKSGSSLPSREGKNVGGEVNIKKHCKATGSSSIAPGKGKGKK